MKKWSTHIVIFFIGLSLFRCHNYVKNDSLKKKEEIQFLLTNIYINTYTDRKKSDVPYIFYDYTVLNNSNDTARFNIRRHKFDSPTKSKSFCIVKKDTLELYGGAITPDHITILPKSSLKIDLNIDPMEVMDLYEKIHGSDAPWPPSWKDFLTEIALSSKNYFYWNDYVITDVGQRKKITYRNPSDSSIVEWK